MEAEIVRGASIRRIAEANGLSESALRRHAAEHLPAALADAESARESARAEWLLAESLALQAKALELVARAEGEGDVRAAVVALREARECVALRAKVAAELHRTADATASPSMLVEYVEPVADAQESAGAG